jgi:hypothetical protein
MTGRGANGRRGRLKPSPIVGSNPTAPIQNELDTEFLNFQLAGYCDSQGRQMYGVVLSFNEPPELPDGYSSPERAWKAGLTAAKRIVADVSRDLSKISRRIK